MEKVAAEKTHKKIVSWTPQEDEVLNDYISKHGTDNWTSIAALFKDKTSRQCRRRWYTYLNSECKKGGWSPDEDMLLCEAQKVFGNRWTEIAKVVSGRTDNAVKNRFSTLCKKRAKIEALSKENNIPCIDTCSKKIIIQNGCASGRIAESAAQLRHTSYNYETPCSIENHKQFKHEDQSRPPLAVISQNINVVGSLPTHRYIRNKEKAIVSNAPSNKNHSGFIRRDDPKLSALLQQAELLSSLANEVNSESTNKSLDDAWKELQDYLVQTDESGMLSEMSSVDLLDIRDLIEDHRSDSVVEDLPSQSSSGLSNQSICNTNALENKNYGFEECYLKELLSPSTGSVVATQDQISRILDVTLQPVKETDESNRNVEDAVLQPIKETEESSGNILLAPNSECGSPLEMVPPFQSFTEAISSPKFSASERNFLLSVLRSSPATPGPNSSQPPACKRALLNSLLNS